MEASSKTADRSITFGKGHQIQANRPAPAPRRMLRDTLEELQEAVENSVRSVVTSGIDTAADRASETIERLARTGVRPVITVPAQNHGNPTESPSHVILHSRCFEDSAAQPHAGTVHERFLFAPLALPPAATSYLDVQRVLQRSRRVMHRARLACSGLVRYVRCRPSYAAALAGVLLIVMLSMTVEHAETKQAPQNSGGSSASASSYDADPLNTSEGQLLTVIARPQQTLRELSLLYAGRFDSDLLKEICRLNPELSDPQHLEAGQLVRIPLPPGKLHKVIETSDPDSDSGSRSSVLVRSFALLHGIW